MADPLQNLLTESGKDTLYIVTGAAGHLGSTILRRLAPCGCRVRGLLLPGEEPEVTFPGLQYFHGDIRRPETLRALFEPVPGLGTTVMHTAALISIAEKMPPLLYEVNVGGVKNILRLCAEFRVSRLVQVSSVHAIPEPPRGQTITEPAFFSPDLVRGAYAKTKAEAAQAVLDSAAAGLDAVIVFPSGIIGPFDRGRNHLVQLLADYLRGKLPACVDGGYDFVDVRDAADGCLRAALLGRAGEGYILSGQYLTISRLLELAGGCCGRKPVPALPVWLAEAAVPLIRRWAALRGRRPLYTRCSLDALGSNCSFSCEKARRELGYAPRPLNETVADTVAWLRENVPGC